MKNVIFSLSDVVFHRQLIKNNRERRLTMLDRIKIGNFLRELRNEKGLTQEEIAEKFGVSSRSVSRWENGNTMPELGVLVELSFFYAVDIKEIIDGERKSENMEKEVVNTLEKVADYAKEEKKIAIKTKMLLTSLGTILVVAVVILLIWLARTIPLVNVTGEEVDVKSVYRYETEDGYKYFVLYESPNYTGQTRLNYSYKEDSTLTINIKKALLATKITDLPTITEIVVHECGWSSGDNGEHDFNDYDAVTFAGKTIWERDKNENNQVPEYVLAYEEFMSAGGKITSWTIEDEYLQAWYNDGSSVKWDYDGNILLDAQE